MIEKIKKRDGSIEEFNSEKINNAILKAMGEKAKKDKAEKITKQVVKILEEHYKNVLPGVEDIQDLVEEQLIKNGMADVAKSYILYRQKRQEYREFKTIFGIRDELKLRPNALTVLANRYLLKNEQGDITESTANLFLRTAKTVAQAERNYTKSTRKIEEEYYKAMTNLEFLPNTPTLMNAGTPLGQLSACFVLPIEDDLQKIMKTCTDMAVIHQSGGGTGFSFTKIRPEGDIVKSTKGTASGPVSFMQIFDVTTNIIKQGGKRRGANMAILKYNHPDILKFITAKETKGKLENFNLSVAVTEEFMKAAAEKKEIPLVNPRNGKTTAKVNASDLLDLIARSAWQTGDPGLVFIDEINKTNPTKKIGEIESTNPCGEQPLHPYESCVLGSINLDKFVKNKKPQWKNLSAVIKTAVRFLDDVIDVNKYPLPEIEQATKANRRIGLGVMGFAEMLIQMDIQYDSPRAVKFAEQLMKFISEEAKKTSIELGKQKGNFPNFEKSEIKGKNMRNATLTTIAPTGSISIIAGTSSGIEPLFAVSYVREALGGMHLLEVNSLFEQIAKEKGFYSRELMMKIAKTGKVTGIKEVPKKIQQLFRTALEIKPEDHLKIQAAFQKYTDNAVSKTINLPENTTPTDVKKIFLLAHKLKCKGITIYRYGSKEKQALYIGKAPDERVKAGSEYAGGNPCNECAH